MTGAARDDTRVGVAAMFGATAVLSLQDVLGKSLAGRYPVVEMLAIRALLGAVIVLLGFAGVLIVVRPDASGVEPAALYVLAGSFLYPLAMVTTRALSRHDPAQSMLAWMLVIQTVAAGVATVWVWQTPSPRAWFEMSVLGISGIVGHVGLIMAFSRAPVAVLAPIEYSALVFAAVFGFLVWGDVPQTAFWVGAPLIVASALLGSLVDRLGAPVVRAPALSSGP